MMTQSFWSRLKLNPHPKRHYRFFSKFFFFQNFLSVRSTYVHIRRVSYLEAVSTWRTIQSVAKRKIFSGSLKGRTEGVVSSCRQSRNSLVWAIFSSQLWDEFGRKIYKFHGLVKDFLLKLEASVSQK